MLNQTPRRHPAPLRRWPACPFDARSRFVKIALSKPRKRSLILTRSILEAWQKTPTTRPVIFSSCFLQGILRSMGHAPCWSRGLRFVWLPESCVVVCVSSVALWLPWVNHMHNLKRKQKSQEAPMQNCSPRGVKRSKLKPIRPIHVPSNFLFG